MTEASGSNLLEILEVIVNTGFRENLATILQLANPHTTLTKAHEPCFFL